MAINFMNLLGAVTQSGMNPSAEARMQNGANNSANAMGSGLQNLLSGLVGGGQSLINRAEQAVGGRDNLAAAGIGALLGSLSRKSNSSLGVVGGGLMGLLGMMAFKALKNAGQNPQPPLAGTEVPRSEAEARRLENDAQLILTAMLDAAKADGTVDASELNRITANMKESGVGQEGMSYVISQLQSPMSTEAIVAAVRGRPELAAQVYSASLMVIEVDTPEERAYLVRLAAAMDLAPEVARNIEQLVGMRGA